MLPISGTGEKRKKGCRLRTLHERCWGSVIGRVESTHDFKIEKFCSLLAVVVRKFNVGQRRQSWGPQLKAFWQWRIAFTPSGSPSLCAQTPGHALGNLGLSVEAIIQQRHSGRRWQPPHLAAKHFSRCVLPKPRVELTGQSRPL